MGSPFFVCTDKNLKLFCKDHRGFISCFCLLRIIPAIHLTKILGIYKLSSQLCVWQKIFVHSYYAPEWKSYASNSDLSASLQDTHPKASPLGEAVSEAD